MPVLFVASLFYSAAAALASVAVAAALWGLVRRLGLRFRSLNIEAAWASCRLTRGDLERIIAGRDLPSAAEIFGVPLGH
ncbi:MAG: hypothetical protein GSR80_001449 [Desulfurococcales archaeon]|nr:hypothetical protein [Desulfurococcales archaeon]